LHPGEAGIPSLPVPAIQARFDHLAGVPQPLVSK
jgi:hypothetical protein